MEKEEKVVTLGRVLKVAFGNWKLFVPVCLGVTVAAALGIQYGLNSYRGKYVSTFSYSSPDLANDQYADGSNFFYRNLISFNNLSSVKESNPDYASIDVQKMLDSNSINITTNVDEKTYTITLAYNQIKNGGLAKNFVKDIAESALKKDAEIVNDSEFDNSLKLYDAADTFEEQVKYLYRQADFLVNSYDAITGTSTNKDGSTQKTTTLPIAITEQASANKEKIVMTFDEDFVTNMNLRIATYGYVKDYEAPEVKNYTTKKEQLSEEKALNKGKIDALETEISNISSEAAISSFSEEVEKLIFRNVEIDHEIEVIDKKLSNKGKTPEGIPGYIEFVNDMELYKEKLIGAVADYKTVLKSAYVDSAEVTFEDSSVIKLTSTINIFINIPISLVLGVVVAAAVNLIVDRKKLYE